MQTLSYSITTHTSQHNFKSVLSLNKQMVFEQLYSVSFLRKHPSVGFLLGAGYTIIGLAIALFLWREDPALIAVGVTALLLMPSLFQLRKPTELNGRSFATFKDFMKFTYTDIKVYVYIFFGILLTFAVFSIMLPKLAAGHLFKTQFEIVSGGGATFSMGLFWELFAWNLRVLGPMFRPLTSCREWSNNLYSMECKRLGNDIRESCKDSSTGNNSKPLHTICTGNT